MLFITFLVWHTFIFLIPEKIYGIFFFATKMRGLCNDASLEYFVRSSLKLVIYAEKAWYIFLDQQAPIENRGRVFVTNMTVCWCLYQAQYRCCPLRPQWTMGQTTTFTSFGMWHLTGSSIINLAPINFQILLHNLCFFLQYLFVIHSQCEQNVR